MIYALVFVVLALMAVFALLVRVNNKTKLLTKWMEAIDTYQTIFQQKHDLDIELTKAKISQINLKCDTSRGTEDILAHFIDLLLNHFKLRINYISPKMELTPAVEKEEAKTTHRKARPKQEKEKTGGKA